VTRTGSHCDLVVIASSTGGPRALETVCANLPASLPVPILVVQHMPAEFTERFAQRLNTVSPLKVSQAKDGELALPGCMYIAPGDKHLIITASRRMQLTDTAPVNNCRPAADILFASAAQAHPRTLAVVLTGMGRDGATGAARIHAGGGSVLVQNQETSTVWGMPGAVVQDGTPATVAPLSAIAAHIIIMTSRTRP